MAESTCKEPGKEIRQLARVLKARVMPLHLIHPENIVRILGFSDLAILLLHRQE